MRRRALTSADRLIWASYVQQVAPLPGVSAPPPPTPPTPPDDPSTRPIAIATTATPVAAPGRRPLAPVELGTAPGGLDRSTWTKFRAGKLSPARTLDLHGHTAQRAHATLHAFLRQAVADRLRCVEVITGRGSGEGGVIRREFPLWLNDPALRPAILAASHPHPANPGSVRLLLRRVR